MNKRKCLKVLVCCSLMLSMVCFPAYAGPKKGYVGPNVNVESERLPANIKRAIDFVTATVRGAFFSAADLQITNENGEIGVSAHAYMSTAIDELYMTIYVDRWIEKEHRWAQVAYYDFEFYAEDYPNGLTSETVEFIIDNQPKNNQYRLRGSYMAIKDGAMEGFGPVTDGVLIE